uniref:Uncharacterized protein n=1 Tax=Rhizophora mucronata TaxID=61149 RepID=A0A2P2QZT3_RHIMU
MLRSEISDLIKYIHNCLTKTKC